jgi:uncharacterized membrane protein
MRDTRESARTESLTTHLAQVPAVIYHAFTTFLAVPTLIVAAFVLLAVGTYALDRGGSGWFAPLYAFLRDHLFADAESTTQVLATVGGGMITVTSITFSLLLVALQQSAGSMTHAVFDQFLRRRLNQLYAGWFIGITLYTLVTLATVGPEFNPIWGATLSLLLAISALYVLLLLQYSAIEQMRPASILEAIHDHALRARERQRPLLRRTIRVARKPGAGDRTVWAPRDGFVTAVDLGVLERALREAPGAEVELCLPIGGYVAFHDPLARIRTGSPDQATGLEESVQRAVRLERERDLDHDPAYAIEQIETIAWTAISTSKQDPAPGREAARNLRDLLARWTLADEEEDAESTARLAVVYVDDVFEQLVSALESLMVVASESMQHQVYAEILQGFAVALERLPVPLARRAAEAVQRSLPGLGDHVLTVELERALSAVAEAMDRSGLVAEATAVRAARDDLAATVGRLSSRGARVSER